MPRDLIFNPRQRTLLRPSIPAGENWISLGLILLLVLIVAWTVTQKNKYDPQARRLSPELLLQSAGRAELYTPPIKVWSESGGEGSPAPVMDLGVFPATVSDSTWAAKNPVKVFDADTLYEKINGEAPRFLRQGFRAMHYLTLRSESSGQEISIELYEQNDIGGSMGLFAEHQSAGGVIEQQDQVYYFRTSIGVIGRKGRFFFRVAGDAVTPEIQEKSRQLIDAFAGLPEDADSPSAANIELTLLTREMGLAPEQVYLQRENVFQFDFVRDVWFGRLGPEGSEQVFLHRAESPEAAQVLFADIVAEQSYDYEIKNQKETSALLWHGYLQNYFAIAVEQSFVYGIENSPDQAATEELMRKLSGVLTNGE